jgi:hypothetical protein
MEWPEVIAKGFYSIPGEHGLVIGSTGTGKTQALYYILQGLKKYSPEETICWFDCGKSGELLKLSEWGEVVVHLPGSTQIDIKCKDEKNQARFSYMRYETAADLWKNVQKNKINVIELEPFYPEPLEFSKRLRDIFKELIFAARDNYLSHAIPMAIFIDEIQWYVPSDRSSLCVAHSEGAKWFQRNIEMLRSMRVRVVAATQNWWKMRVGVRDSFSWLWCRRGTRFTTDKHRLAKFNDHFSKLHDDEVIVIKPDGIFSNVLVLEYYGTGSKLGTVIYKRASDIPDLSAYA